MQAHAYISSFKSLDEVKDLKLNGRNFYNLVLKYRNRLDFKHTEDSELAAFICYACHHPVKLLLFVDSFDIMKSGVPNYCCVALALRDCGYEPLGFIADSKWLETLSYQVQAFFREISDKVQIDTSKSEVIINIYGEEEVKHQLPKGRKKAENFFTSKGIILDQIHLDNICLAVHRLFHKVLEMQKLNLRNIQIIANDTLEMEDIHYYISKKRKRLKNIKEKSYDIIFTDFTLCQFSSEQEVIKFLDQIHELLRFDGYFMGLEYSPDKFFKQNYHSSKGYDVQLLEQLDKHSAKLQISYNSKRVEGLTKVDYWWDKRTLNKCFKKAGFKQMEYLKPICHLYAQEFIQNYVNDGSSAFYIAKKEEKVSV